MLDLADVERLPQDRALASDDRESVDNIDNTLDLFDNDILSDSNPDIDGGTSQNESPARQGELQSTDDVTEGESQISELWFKDGGTSQSCSDRSTIHGDGEERATRPLDTALYRDGGTS